MGQKTRRLYSFLVVVFVASVLLGCAMAQQRTVEAKEERPTMPAMEGRVIAMSKYPFDETVSRLKQAIEAQNMVVVFSADHQAMLEMVGLKTKGMVGIEFFHPRYGKVIVQNDHMAGIEIPFRIVVMEGDMGTMISYYRPSYTFRNYPKLAELGKELDGVLAKIEQAVTK